VLPKSTPPLDFGIEDEDSEDFTEEEALKAIPTKCQTDLVERIIAEGSSVHSYELRKREGHLYSRVTFVKGWVLGDEGKIPMSTVPGHTTIFIVDWLK
jgi:hypothetical protein